MEAPRTGFINILHTTEGTVRQTFATRIGELATSCGEDWRPPQYVGGRPPGQCGGRIRQRVMADTCPSCPTASTATRGDRVSSLWSWLGGLAGAFENL